MKKHISALIFIFILHSAPTALAQGTLQLLPRAQVNETLQTFLASVKTNMKLQEFVYPEGALIDEKRRAPSDDEIYDYYTYDLGACLVTVSAFREHVREISIPVKDSACVFDIAPLAEIPVNNTVLTSEFTIRKIHEFLIDGGEYHHYVFIEENAGNFRIFNFWYQDFIGVQVTAGYETEMNSEIGQRYQSYKAAFSTLTDRTQIMELQESIFNLVADQKVTTLTIYTVGQWCGTERIGMYRQREEYYRAHGIDLKE